MKSGGATKRKEVGDESGFCSRSAGDSLYLGHMQEGGEKREWTWCSGANGLEING